MPWPPTVAIVVCNEFDSHLVCAQMACAAEI